MASLHLENHDIALRALTERRISHRSSMLPLESAAIVRGLLRCHRTDEAWEVLEDELSLPLPGWVRFDHEDQHHEGRLPEEATRRKTEIKERIVHRARSIGSIASRHFYEEEPTKGMHALRKLREMGDIVLEAGLTAEEVGMPWERIVRGAALCESKRRDGKWDVRDKDGGGGS